MHWRCELLIVDFKQNFIEVSLENFLILTTEKVGLYFFSISLTEITVYTKPQIIRVVGNTINLFRKFDQGIFCSGAMSFDALVGR